MNNPFEEFLSSVPIKPMTRAVRKPRAEVQPYAGSDEERQVKLAKAEAAYLDSPGARINNVGTCWVNKLWIVRYDEQFAKAQVAS